MSRKIIYIKMSKENLIRLIQEGFKYRDANCSHLGVLIDLSDMASFDDPIWRVRKSMVSGSGMSLEDYKIVMKMKIDLLMSFDRAFDDSYWIDEIEQCIGDELMVFEELLVEKLGNMTIQTVGDSEKLFKRIRSDQRYSIAKNIMKYF